MVLLLQEVKIYYLSSNIYYKIGLYSDLCSYKFSQFWFSVSGPSNFNIKRCLVLAVHTLIRDSQGFELIWCARRSILYNLCFVCFFIIIGSNGYMNLWDFDTGFRFQRISRARVYESHEIPICVFATKFDKTGKKLICSDSCNVVKIYGEAYSSRVNGSWIIFSNPL